MDYRRADAIMQEVAQLVRGDFLINDDRDLTLAVTKKFASRKSEYVGGVQSFGVQKMFCTKQCTREQDQYIIGRDGIVFGPYFAFPAGKYIAYFYVEHAPKDCNFIIESQQTGVIYSAKAGEIQPVDEGVYALEFSLPQKVEQLELKVYNPTDTPVIFHKVTVTIPLGEMAAASTKHSSEHVPAASESAPVPVDGDDACGAILEDLHSEQSVFARITKDMGTMVECRPPHNTKYAFFKKMVRKVINSYVFFQVEFNKKLLQQQRNLVSQYRKLLSAVTALWTRQNSHEIRLAQLEQQILTANRQLTQLQELCRHHEETISKYKSELTMYQSIITEQSKQLCDTREVIATQVRMMQEDVNHRTDEIWRNITDQGKQLHDTKEVIATQVHLIQEDVDHRTDEIWEKLKEIAHDLQWIRDNTASTTQQVQMSIDGKLNDLWAKIKRIDDEFEGIWKHNRETNLNLDSVWHTYNTMRQELFYEIDYRTRTATAAPSDTAAIIVPKILPKAAEKIAAQGGKIRLNLGSGNLSVAGYLSVDARELSNVDVVADVSKLPYEQGTVDEIFSAHLIEHFTRQRMEKELLPYWKSLLKTGGVFRVIFPDLEAMLQAYEAGEMDFNLLAEIIMGGQDYQLDYHYAVYSPELVTTMLQSAGFHDIQIVAQGRENGGCRETEIVAIK